MAGLLQHKVIRNSARNRSRRGSGLLELAFFLMPSFALICGFLDVGMALFTWNTLQNAVREGTRYAITYQVDGSGQQVTSIKNTVSTWAMGLVQASSNSSSGVNVPYIEVNFYTSPTTANPNGILLPATGTPNAPGNIVEVAVRNYPYALMAPFSGAIGATVSTSFYATPGTSMRVQVFSADVLGGTPVAGTPAI